MAAISSVDRAVTVGVLIAVPKCEAKKVDVEKQTQNGSPLGKTQQVYPQEESKEKVALYLELAGRLRCTAAALPLWRLFLRVKMLRDAARFVAFAQEEVTRGYQSSRWS